MAFLFIYFLFIDPDEREHRGKEESSLEDTRVGENCSERNTDKIVPRSVVEQPCSEKGQVDHNIDDKSEIQEAQPESSIEESNSNNKKDENVEKLNVEEDAQKLKHKECIDAGEDTCKKERDFAVSNVRSHSEEQLREVQEALSESSFEEPKSNSKKDEVVKNVEETLNVEEDVQKLEHKEGINIGKDVCKKEKNSTDSHVRDDDQGQLREENDPEQSSSEKAQNQSVDEKDRPDSKEEDGSETQNFEDEAGNVENEKGERKNEDGSEN